MKSFPFVILEICCQFRFCYYLQNVFLDWLARMPGIKGAANWYTSKLNSKKAQITKYAKWGLFLFVAVPLPGTGAWSGAMLVHFENASCSCFRFDCSRGCRCWTDYGNRIFRIVSLVCVRNAKTFVMALLRQSIPKTWFSMTGTDPRVCFFMRCIQQVQMWSASYDIAIRG